MVSSDLTDIDVATAPLADVLALAQKLSADVAGSAGFSASTEDMTFAVDQLVDFRSMEHIDPRTTNIPRIMSDLLDWGGKRATKPVKKAVSKHLMSQRESDGASLYPHAVERVSQASVFAPFLQPDRLARVIATPLPAGAFAPIRFPATLERKLKKLVGHFHDDRLELLFISLLETVHQGRWWNATNGLGRPNARRNRQFELDEQLLGRLNELAKDRVTTLLERPYYSDQFATELSEIRLTDEVRDALGVQAAIGFADPDADLLAAALVDLYPGQRPENPMRSIVDALEFAVGDEDPREVLPEKPDAWHELHPDVELAPYPLPDFAKELDGTLVPGTGENGSQAAQIQVIRNGPELHANRDEMGNCTGSFHERCAAGNAVILKIVQDGVVYNASIVRGGYWGDGNGDWHLGELNSRYNRGGVSEGLRNGVEQLVPATNN